VGLLSRSTNGLHAFAAAKHGQGPRLSLDQSGYRISDKEAASQYLKYHGTSSKHASKIIIRFELFGHTRLFQRPEHCIITSSGLPVLYLFQSGYIYTALTDFWHRRHWPKTLSMDSESDLEGQAGDVNSREGQDFS
jgi:hypothetical protein